MELSLTTYVFFIVLTSNKQTNTHVGGKKEDQVALEHSPKKCGMRSKGTHYHRKSSLKLYKNCICGLNFKFVVSKPTMKVSLNASDPFGMGNIYPRATI